MGTRLAVLATLALSLLASNSGTPWAAAAEPSLARTDGPPADASATQAEPQQIDERAKQILDKAASNLMAISSIEFRAERDMKFDFPKADAPGVSELPSGAKDSYMFRCDGDLWRVDEFKEDGSHLESYSFNGKLFQALSVEFSTFRESKHRMGTRPQVPFPHPISQAYEWVFPVKGNYLTSNWDELRDRGEWNALTKGARYIGRAKPETTIETLEVTRIINSRPAFTYSIDFDKERGYAPVSWSVPQRNTAPITVVVKRWADIDSGSGRRIWLPVEASYDSSDIKGTVRIVESTLRVNQPIAEEVFTLPRSAAKHDLGPYGLDEKTADFFKTRGPLAERLTNAHDDALLNRQRVLVIFGDPDAECSQRLFELREKDWRRPLYEYQQLPIGKNDVAAIHAIRKTYSNLADVKWPSLVVLGETGKALDSLALSSSSAGITTDSVKTVEFLKKYALEKLDAERLLAGALAKAKGEDKKVFLQETGIYCAPCRRLSRFFDKHAGVLDQNYVYLKIDAARTTHGPEVIKRLRTDGTIGIPWIAILDQDGKVVTTELGFPSHEAKDIDEFLAMFSETAPRLTAEQLKELRSDLEKGP
jgi:hypothetical protein